MFVNKKICSKCNGNCCKKMPGIYYPEDFNIQKDFSNLETAINSSKIAIDWWEGDPREELDELNLVYYVRPATKDKEGVLFDPSWGGECIFLTSTGCQLNENARPLNCRKLEPVENGTCILHDNISKRNAAIAWLPYQKKLIQYKELDYD